MKEKAKNFLSLFMRFGLSAALLGWLFFKIDYKHIWIAVKGADLNYLLLAGVVYFFLNFAIWWRWMILMKAMNLKFKKLSALRWFFIGLFSSLFLPSSVGGDVIKAIGMAKETDHKTKVFASIVLDRLIGFVAIVLIAFLAFWGGHSIVDDPSIVVSILGMTMFSLILGTVLFSHRVFSWTTRIFGRWPKLKEGLMKLHYDVVLLKNKKRQALLTITISVVAQAILAFDYFLIAKALHQNIDLYYFMIFSPLVCVATSLPSIGGLGVREFGWVYFLSKVGVTQSVALTLSLISFAFMVVVGCLGGIFYVATLSVRRVQLNQASPAVS